MLGNRLTITFATENRVDEIINEGHLIKGLRITKKLNDHARLIFLGGQIIPELKEEYLQKAALKTEIKVEYMNEVIFVGIITNIKLLYVPGDNIFNMEVSASSYTAFMDNALTSRSFQNKELTYSKLLEKFRVNYGNASFSLASEYSSKKLGEFTLQYNETDWQFLKRMASRFKTGLLSDAVSSTPSFVFGVPEIEPIPMPQKIHYISIKKRIFSYRRALANYYKDSKDVQPQESDFVYYKTLTPVFYDVGDQLSLTDKIKLYVYKAEAFWKGSDLYYECLLSTRIGLQQRPLYNKSISGISLTGQVIAAEKDNVKVKFWIDLEQKKEDAYWFPYTTVYSAEEHTGHYFMPEIGDSINVYFPSSKDEEGFAVGSLRVIERKSDQLSLPYMKYLRTVNNKEVAFDRNKITISSDIIKQTEKKDKDHNKETGKEKNETIVVQLDQDQGVNISSPLNIRLYADGNIAFQGKKVTIVSEDTISLGSKQGCIKMNEKGGFTHIYGLQILKSAEEDNSGPKLEQVDVTTPPPNTGKPDYKAFLEKLHLEESKDCPNDGYGARKGSQKRRDTQFFGRYQIGWFGLDDAGFWLEESREWTALAKGKKYEINRIEDFLNSKKAQEDSIREYHKKIWGYIKIIYDRYITEKNGEKKHRTCLGQMLPKTSGGTTNVIVTASGLLAATHLIGSGSMKYQFGLGPKPSSAKEKNGLICDGNETPCSHYMEVLKGFDLSEILGHDPDLKYKNDK